MNKILRNSAGLALLSSLFLAGCGGGSDTPAPVAAPEETRDQDSRTAFLAPNFAAASDYEAGPNGSPSFKALTGATATSRWVGVLNGAGYRIEVPENWNGKLVMYAHGYVGEHYQLAITTPSIRRHLIENGYAWAASSYSKNWYDVRVGVEDTNALARYFTAIALQNGRLLTSPTKTYIVGHSMGGHIAAAAVEQETLQTAINKFRYDGAVPMCGVHGDTELFDYFAATQLAAQTLAGYGSTASTNWSTIATTVRDAMWSQFPSATATTFVPGMSTSEGVKLREVVKNLTGGERPGFNQSYAHPLQATVWGTFGRDGTVNGILNKSSLDTNRFVYHLDTSLDVQSSEEVTFNSNIQKLTAAADVNRLRTDGLRWIPKVNGQFTVPVVTLHTLGDMYVPFSMQQIYRARANANGSGNLLVQRAIRAPSHCDFTIAEQVEAFNAMVTWEQGGAKPDGDDVATPATVASPSYGCAFTRTPTAADSAGTTFGRNYIAAGLTPCS